MHPDSELDFADRYGRKRTRGQLVARAFLLLAILAFFIWFYWAATFHSNPTVKSTLISFKSVNERSMGITFKITKKNPDSKVICRLVAVDIDKYVVGEISYQVPSGNRSETIYTQIPTRSKSVSASVSDCTVA